MNPSNLIRVNNRHSQYLEELASGYATDVYDRGTILYTWRKRKDLSPIIDFRRIGRDHFLAIKKKQFTVAKKTRKYTFFI